LVPDVPKLDDVSRRARGWALSSPSIQPGRIIELVPPDPHLPEFDLERRLLDLEVNEDGGVRLFCSGASTTLGGDVECVTDSLVIGLTKRLVLIAETIATTTGWLGSWDFGIAIKRLRGLLSLRLVQHGQQYLATPFSEEDYQEMLRATGERVIKDADGIVADLTGRLNRALGGSAPVPQ
jgi:hypothetical protein